MSPCPVFLGLDVGKKKDRAAWVGVVPKRLGVAEEPSWSVVVCEQAPVWTPYSTVASRTRDLAKAFAGGGWPVLVAVDATGIGAAVVEDLRAGEGHAEILAVTSHGGKKLTGEWPDLGVPKTSLVEALDAVMRARTLTVTGTLPAAADLKVQLKDYVAKTGKNGHVRYEAAHERTHDDLVAAIQLSMFAGKRWWEICRSMTPGSRA